MCAVCCRVIFRNSIFCVYNIILTSENINKNLIKNKKNPCVIRQVQIVNYLLTVVKLLSRFLKNKLCVILQSEKPIYLRQVTD